MKKSTTVQQVGTTLVAAFEKADPPLIWKFDLERNHSFSLAMREEGGSWQLGVTSAEGDFHPVARFRSRDDADEAFGKTQQALMLKAKSRGRGTTISLVILLVVIVVIVLPVMMAMHALRANMSTALRASSASSAMKDGVPMNADTVLKPPP